MSIDDMEQSMNRIVRIGGSPLAHQWTDDAGTDEIRTSNCNNETGTEKECLPIFLRIKCINAHTGYYCEKRPKVSDNEIENIQEGTVAVVDCDNDIIVE